MTMRLLVLFVILHCCACSRAEEAVVPRPDVKGSKTTEDVITIPLEEIWSTEQKYFGGMEHPKTRYVAKLEGGVPPGRGPLLNAIRKELGSGSIQDIADPAFAVEGVDLEALRNAHAVLVEKQPRPTVLSMDGAISIVFYSLYSPYYTALTDVTRWGNTIQIRYELIPHSENIMTRHFSLIPLGKLMSGHYQVEIDHEPYETRFSKFGRSGPDKSLPERVSASFEFDVK